MNKSWQVITHEGRSIELTREQAGRLDRGDCSFMGGLADRLEPGEYSIYAPDGGPLLMCIAVTA